MELELSSLLIREENSSRIIVLDRIITMILGEEYWKNNKYIISRFVINSSIQLKIEAFDVHKSDL